MKNTELRIGNLVHYQINDKFDEREQWNEVIKIEAIDFECFDKYYLPIELTDEWLLKFGFECRVVYGNNHWLNNQILIFEDKKGKFEFAWGLKIKSVHQLQNIHFALTGEELKECDI